jgi:hypothetical protein
MERRIIEKTVKTRTMIIEEEDFFSLLSKILSNG